TLVNGKRVGSIELRGGDVVRIGEYELSYRAPLRAARTPKATTPWSGPEIVCQGCGHSADAEAVVCAICGTSLSTGQPPAGAQLAGLARPNEDVGATGFGLERLKQWFSDIVHRRRQRTTGQDVVSVSLVASMQPQTVPPPPLASAPFEDMSVDPAAEVNS
ncbi:MAG: hypothetical protein ACREJC_20570, partial [Tepidisphaeraceae bacterium]